MPQVIYQIQSQGADAEQVDDGRVYPRINPTPGRLSGQFWEYEFMRFISIDIPQGANILSAKLTVVGLLGDQGVPPNLTIYAEAADDPSAIQSSQGENTSEISNKPSTTNTVAWNNPLVPKETQVDSPDISAIIQELVNRNGWEKNNAINIIIQSADPITDNNSLHLYGFGGNPAKAAILTIDYTPLSGGITQITQPKIKQFWHKIFDKDGNYITTWAKEVNNKPQFKWRVNGGMGEMKIDLKRKASNFGENSDVKMGNKVETWVQDGDQEIGRRVWQGVLDRYEPIVLADGTQGVRVRAVSKLIEMQNRIVRDGDDNTTVTKLSKDPSTILTEIINSASAGSVLQVGDIKATGTTVSYEFNANDFVEAFKIITRLSPQYWFWRLNPDNTVDFQVADYDEIQHKFYVGKHVNNVMMTKSIESLINRVYFMGGGNPNMFRKYERTSSQEEFGLREKFIKDERVTVVATAQIISERLLDDVDHPISEIEFVILDNNIDPVNGYDIESLKPGQIIQILHPEVAYGFTLWDQATWDIDYWDFDIEKAFGNPHQIVEINYEFNKCIIKASAKFADINQRIEDIMRNLDTTSKVNLPSAPT